MLREAQILVMFLISYTYTYVGSITRSKIFWDNVRRSACESCVELD